MPLFRDYLEGRMKNAGIPKEKGPPFGRFLLWLTQELPSVAATPEALLARADPAPDAARCMRPLLILETANDPIIPAAAPESLRLAASTNAFAHVIETRYGGHIGQPGWSPKWFAAVIAAFFLYSPEVAN
jgi:hypothetical protein